MNVVVELMKFHNFNGWRTCPCTHSYHSCRKACTCARTRGPDVASFMSQFLYSSLCVALHLTPKLPFHLPSVVCWPSCSLCFVRIVSCAIVTAGTSALYSSKNKAFLRKRKSSLGCMWSIAFVKFPVLQCQTKQHKKHLFVILLLLL